MPRDTALGDAARHGNHDAKSPAGGNRICHGGDPRRRRPARHRAASSSTEPQFAEHFRALVQADVRARLSTAALNRQPFNERLALFWANHFTVSITRGSARGIVGAFEREAIGSLDLPR